MTARLRILGRPGSINVRKVLWTADEIGLDYVHEADWGTAAAPTRSAEYLAINPNGLVPAIINEDIVLWESNTICRYLCARAGRADLLPLAPSDRARVEMWMDWQATELNGAWRYAFMSFVRRDPAFANAENAASSARLWNEKMQLLDRRLQETGAYVAGANFTLADIVLGLSVHRWRETPIEHAELPATRAWFETLQKRKAFAPWTVYP